MVDDLFINVCLETDEFCHLQVHLQGAASILVDLF